MRRPLVEKLALKLAKSNPSWSKEKCETLAKAAVTEPTKPAAMKHGTYIGDIPLLKGKTALLRDNPGSSSMYLAQFDDTWLTYNGIELGYHWHLFSRNDFQLDEEETGKYEQYSKP